jgi:hypothetical protein
LGNGGVSVVGVVGGGGGGGGGRVSISILHDPVFSRFSSILCHQLSI